MSESQKQGDMPPQAASDVTQLLVKCRRGDAQALSDLLPVVYDELRRIAARYMARENAGHTLDATSLVHEAYLKLVDQRSVEWQNRAHFFGVAAQLMRRILVDHARSRSAAKRGGGMARLTLGGSFELADQTATDIVALDDALKTLVTIDERQARMVELRYFGGLSVEETAEVLQISPATVKRDWTLARAWLYRELTGQPIPSPSP